MVTVVEAPDEKEIKILQIISQNGLNKYNVLGLDIRNRAVLYIEDFPTNKEFQILEYKYKILDGKDMPDYENLPDYLPGYRPVFCVLMCSIHNDREYKYYYNDEEPVITLNPNKE